MSDSQIIIKADLIDFVKDSQTGYYNVSVIVGQDKYKGAGTTAEKALANLLDSVSDNFKKTAVLDSHGSLITAESLKNK